MQLEPGATLGRYRIVGPVGAGGMGVVYRAHDTELGRDVAVKVLPEQVAADPRAQTRFEREARAVAALAHVNIVTIHDFGRSEGVTYAVSELLEGESLRDRLARGPIPWREATRIALEIAEGLAAAHRRGIVHRDIKPANVFLTDVGTTKILDFGLVHVEDCAAPDTTDAAVGVTQVGVVLGTPGYMSPEQAVCETLDGRSDLFALGCVLYEMLSGRRAFSGRSPREAMIAAIELEPPALAAAGVDIPPVLATTVAWCLRKRPEERPESASVVAAVLRRALEVTEEATTAAPAVVSHRRRRLPAWLRLTAAGAILTGAWALVHFRGELLARLSNEPPRVSSLAVLPLSDLSAERAEHFADGLTDAVITELARLHSLRVISRTSVQRYRTSTATIPTIASELGVDAIIEGSVTRSGERVRVIVQLIDGRTDTHLFAQAFERELVDVLALQRDIAAAVARETRLTLTPEETTRLDSFPRVIPEAHEAYLLGSLHLNRTTVPDALQAVEHFEHALRLSPDYALALAGLADARIIIAHSHGRPAADDYEPARQAAQRALELDPNLTAAAVTLGQVEAEHDWDWAEAEDRLVQAAAASPSTARVHESLADLLVNLGRDDEAVAHALRALELDPVSAPQLSNLCRVLYFAGRFEDGAARCRQAIELDRDYAVAHGYLCLCLEQLGRYDEALLAAAEANRIFAVPLAESPEVGHLHAVAGRPSEAEAVLSRLRGQSPEAHVPKMACALVEVGLGRTSNALDSLERAVAQREPWVVRLAVDPRLAPLRSDDRFRGLLRRVGLPEPSP